MCSDTSGSGGGGNVDALEKTRTPPFIMLPAMAARKECVTLLLVHGAVV